MKRVLGVKEASVVGSVPSGMVSANPREDRHDGMVM